VFEMGGSATTPPGTAEKVATSAPFGLGPDPALNNYFARRQPTNLTTYTGVTLAATPPYAQTQTPVTGERLDFNGGECGTPQVSMGRTVRLVLSPAGPLPVVALGRAARP
jgi:hypothetical protein